MVYTQVWAVFTTYLFLLLVTCLWVVSRQVGRGKKQEEATEVTTMVSQGTGTQQKIVSRPLIIHPSWCAGGCWFTLAQNPEAAVVQVYTPFVTHAPMCFANQCWDGVLGMGYYVIHPRRLEWFTTKVLVSNDNLSNCETIFLHPNEWSRLVELRRWWATLIAIPRPYPCP